MALLDAANRLTEAISTHVDHFPHTLADKALQIRYDAERTLPVKEQFSQIIQIVERLQFVRDCLTSWLGLPAAGIGLRKADTTGPQVPPEGLVSAVVVTGHTLHHSGWWFEEEVAWLGAHRPDVPIVAVVPDELVNQSEDWIERFGVRGFILSSSTTEVAHVVLRLVMAGETHFPRLPRRPRPAVDPVTEVRPIVLKDHVAERLTIRERAVAFYLGRGYPNKMIARELNMSLSTVKAHVHNIIQKLNVKNRTEVAVAARVN